MSTGNTPIPVPAATRERVQKMLEQRDQIIALIDATLLATREALDVPPMYGMTDLSVGFTPPPEADAPEADAPEAAPPEADAPQG